MHSFAKSFTVLSNQARFDQLLMFEYENVSTAPWRALYVNDETLRLSHKGHIDDNLRPCRRKKAGQYGMHPQTTPTVNSTLL